jgi:SAM-dependent methyltransferase
MKTRRLITRHEAAALDLGARVRIEQSITNAKSSMYARRRPATLDIGAYARYSPERRWMFDCLEDVTDKVVLDLGCGYHPTPLLFAAAGARRVYACDVSANAVAYMRQLAWEHGLGDRVLPILCAGEELPFPNGHIDRIHGEAVLHHLMVSRAGSEISRVLRRGGIGVFKDPLGHNAPLEFARDYFKSSAKATDRPLRFEQIEEFGRAFRSCEYHGFGLTATVVGAGSGRKRWPRIVSVADRLDALMFRASRSLERYGQYVAICVRM